MPKKSTGPKKGDYVKISTNLPPNLSERLDRVVDVLGTDRTRLIVRALEDKMADFEREAAAVEKVRDAQSSRKK